MSRQYEPIQTEVGVTTQSFNDGGLGGGTVGATTPRKLAYDKNGNLLCFGDGALNLWYDPYNLPQFLIAPAESTAIAVDEEDVLGVGLAVVGALAKPIRAGAKVFDVTRGPGKSGGWKGC